MSLPSNACAVKNSTSTSRRFHTFHSPAGCAYSFDPRTPTPTVWSLRIVCSFAAFGASGSFFCFFFCGGQNRLSRFWVGVSGSSYSREFCSFWSLVETVGVKFAVLSQILALVDQRPPWLHICGVETGLENQRGSSQGKAGSCVLLISWFQDPGLLSCSCLRLH